MSEELRLEVIPACDEDEKLYDAIDAASGQDRITWLLNDEGRRVAAIVPVDVAEAHEAMLARVLSTPVGKPKVRFPDVTACLSVNHSGNAGAIMATVARAMKEAGCDQRDIRSFREAVFGCASYADVLQFVMKTVNVE